MTLHTEEKREERRRKDRLEEAGRKRKHELEIAKMYATALPSIHQTNNRNQLLPFHAPQEKMVQSPTKLNSPGLTLPHSSTLQCNFRYGFVNELNDESHPNMTLINAWQAKKQ